MLSQRLLYPFLLSIYFVLFVFSENLGEAYLEQTYRSLATVLLCTTLLTGLLTGLLRSTNKAGFIAALLLTLVFIHSGIYELVQPIIAISAPIFLAFELAALGCIVILALKNVSNWGKLNQTMNIVVGILLLLTISNIARFGLSDEGVILQPDVVQKSISVSDYQLPDEPPNVYYILVDAYARADAMRKYFGYDNTDFINYLEQKGFEVADRSFANYHFTYLAANAALNFEYIADESGFASDDEQNVAKLLSDKVFNNRTGSIFRELGYQVITLQSVGQYVRTAGATDITPNARWLTLNEFDTAVLDTTLLPRVLSKFAGDIFSQRNKIDFVIEETARRSADEGPMFVIAHIMSPHPPFLYDREGNTPKISKFEFGKADHLATDAKGYGDQVHYLNKLLKNLIDQIIANSETPPIIVLQGDHGLRVSMMGNQWEQRSGLEEACLEELFPNLNAMYLPGESGRAAFYESISPVNTFRLILDNYFGSNLGLLDDKSFYPADDYEASAKSFLDITGTQQTCSAEWTKRFDAIREMRQ